MPASARSSSSTDRTSAGRCWSSSATRRPRPNGPTGARGRRPDVVVTPQQLEVTAQSLTAVLAVWLGLTVLTRSAAPPARVFGFLALALVAWSSSVIVQRLSTSFSAAQVAHAIEELSAALILSLIHISEPTRLGMISY